uniref:Uncharacterized protein n=2 Tax=Sipha flava TaxID=143950 RepID=A0A2S2R631_9HEMI
MDLTSIQISNITQRNRPRRPILSNLVELRSQNDTEVEDQHLSSSIDINSEDTVPDIMPTERAHIYNEVNNLQVKRSQQFAIENDGKNQIDQIIRNIESELRCNICFDIFTKMIRLI